MRALRLFAVIFLCGCQSGVSIDIDGGLAFPCTPSSATVRTSEQCPGNLFCGFDGKCHPPDVGGAYACREDFHCGGNFRCGPKQLCVDPTADALRTDAPDVTLERQKVVDARTPWDAGITALGVGRTAYTPSARGVTDVTPVAIAAGRSLYTVATSEQGFSPVNRERFFLGSVELGAPVTQVVAVRDQIIALAGDRTFHFSWTPGQALDAGAGQQRVGTRLKSSSSAFPAVFEFSPDAGTYRVIDARLAADPGFVEDMFDPISDMADTDGTWAYAVVNGQVRIANRKTGLSGRTFSWGTFQIHSPGRDVVLSNCGGGNSSNFRFTVKTVHVGDNPDLSLVERPLVALGIDALREDGGTDPYWMRIDQDLDFCGQDRPRHVARGICPACGPGEQLVDLQWGIDTNRDALLRSECQLPNSGPSAFYDLRTDATGFACFRERRGDVGYRPPATFRSDTSAFTAGVATRNIVQTRRNGFEGYTAITLDRAPSFARTYQDRLVAFSGRKMYREAGPLGMALSEAADVQTTGFPAWMAGQYLLYDDGRLALLSSLDRPAADAEVIALPSRRNLAGPIFGTVATTSDNRAFAVIVANDALLGADVTNASVRSRASIDVKSVPEPQVPILSVALYPKLPADAGTLLQGYVLTDNRLFTLDAKSDEQWTLQATDAPAGNALEVWVDRDRARVGYGDGTVYSLPSGVPISRTLGDGGILDYEQHCGRSWALIPQGLYRLDNVGGPVGDWTAQTGLPPGRAWQRMYASSTPDGGELWVFADDGTAVLMGGTACTP